MSTRTIGTYVHSDSTTAHKGAALAAVLGAESFAATAAKLAYGASAAAWTEVAEAFPEADAARAAAGAEVIGVAVLRLGRGEVGRVEAVVGDGAGVLVKVLSSSDFGAKTDGFIAFARKAADLVRRSGATTWAAAAAADPVVEQERLALSRALRETVAVGEIVVSRV